MSIVIPKEQGQSFERWELTSFDKPQQQRARHAQTANTTTAVRPPPELGKKAPPPLVTEENIETTTSKVEIKLPTAEEIEQIHNEAKAEGYQAGFEEGKRAAQEEGSQAIHAEINRLSGITDHLANALNELDQELAEDVLAFAVEVARQVVSGSLRVHTESLLAVIREAMAALPLHHGTVVIHLNPSDIELVKNHFGEQIQHAGWRIMEDQDIQSGGCRLHAGSSEIDASVETRWRRTLESMGAKPDWLEPSPEK